jgi:hypothetical protein
MTRLFVAPILFNYEFLDKISQRAADSLSFDLSSAELRHQFKISIFISFNRYLLDSLLFLPENKAEEILEKLSLAMMKTDETLTLQILREEIDFFDELVDDFLFIIKKLKR